MQSLSQEPTSHRIRASNAAKHLGLLDTPAKWCIPAKKRSDEAQQLELQALKDAKALLTLHDIATTEEAMKAFQSAKHLASRNLKGIRPTTKKPAKSGATAAVIPKGKLDQHWELELA